LKRSARRLTLAKTKQKLKVLFLSFFAPRISESAKKTNRC
jgi:hypothetical protein